MVLGLAFKSLIHFKFILVCGVFIFLHISTNFPNTIYWTKTTFSPFYVLASCLTLIDYKGVGLFLSSLLCSIDLCVCF